jgi:hypothetical protein
MAKETVNFEGIAPHTHNTYSATIPDGYDGFHWDNLDAYDDRNPDIAGSGFVNAIHSGTAGGFNAFGADASFSADATFSLKSGYFAAAFQSEPVRFAAIVGGVEVAHKTVTLDPNQTFVKFGSHFAHIDGVSISTGGQQGSQVAMDDLKVVFDGPIPAPPHHAAVLPEDHFAHVPAPHCDMGHWMFA